MELHDKALELYEKIKDLEQEIEKKLVFNEEELKDIQCLYHIMRGTLKSLEKAEDIYFKNENHEIQTIHL